jgi:antirestriction protein ArdC
MSKGTDTMEAMTARFIARIEEGTAGKWDKPWVPMMNGTMPVNACTGKPYRGGNVLIGWLTAELCGYTSPWWATYKQWAELGGQVRKGEKGTTMVFWQFVTKTDADGTERDVAFAKTFSVFHADQQDGWEAPTADELDTPDRHDAAERWFGATGADWSEVQGDRACYSPTTDKITVPLLGQFADAGAFYATLAHEHIHWTGHKDRANRDLTGRFGDESYAMEELVAELGAAFVCGTLGLSAVPRDDHASYLAHWVKVLKADGRALWAAASKAQQAHDWLVAQVESTEMVEVSA